MKTKIVFMIISISAILISNCSTMSQTQEERVKRIQSSPQYKNGNFANPIETPMIAPGSTWKLIRAKKRTGDLFFFFFVGDVRKTGSGFTPGHKPFDDVIKS